MFRFGTKAETLTRIAPHLVHVRVPELTYFTVAEWNADREAVWATVTSMFPGGSVIVRSSAVLEDVIIVLWAECSSVVTLYFAGGRSVNPR